MVFIMSLSKLNSSALVIWSTIAFYWEVTAFRVHPRRADAHKCLELTLGGDETSKF